MTYAYNQDCMEAMRTMQDNEFDLAIVDPPYGLGSRLSDGRGKLKNRAIQTMDSTWDTAPNKEYFAELCRVSKHQIIWGGNYFALPACRCFIVWDKQQAFPNFSSAEYAWTSFDEPSKIFVFRAVDVSKSDGCKIHATQKPINLYKWLLTNYAEKGSKILDTHLGSGSSRIAAHDLGYDFVGYEISKDYFQKQEQRFERHTSQGVLA
jgi:site-specific DNA-methyltransferase (adenine-specific)